VTLIIAWLVKNPFMALSLALTLALGGMWLDLKWVKADLATALADKVTLQAAVDQQNKAVDGYKAAVQDAQAHEAAALAKAQAGQAAAHKRALAILSAGGKAVPCPEAWDRLVLAIQGVQWGKAAHP
jgi:hypothetical protein